MPETPPGYEKLLHGACGIAAGDEAVFDLALPQGAAAPFVYNSAHSGRFYPTDLMALTKLDENQIRGSEDCFVDLLFAAAPRLGAALLKALYPRAYVDTNREPYELDPQMFSGPLPAFVTKSSPRIHAGLGTIPKLVAPGRPIYPDKISFAGAMSRIERIYIPYHRALAALLDHVAEAFGGYILIDCHSMPSLEPSMGSSFGPPQGLNSGYGGRPGVEAGGADIILGDRYGQSCASKLSDLAESLFRDLGYGVGRNDPYAGGHNALQYGRPGNGRHVLQVEISRRLYMDEATCEPTGNFTKLAHDLEIWMAALHREVGDQTGGLAGELAFAAPLPKAAE